MYTYTTIGLTEQSTDDMSINGEGGIANIFLK